MKKFATDAINKEYIVMKPQVVGESLPEDRRRWRKNTALTDLSFHQFELGLSNTRLSTFDAADIDSRSRRSTIQPESAALSPVEGISQEDLGDGLSLNHNPLASVPDPITTRLSHACTSFRGNEVDSESAASLVRAASPRLKIETAQNADSPSPVWQKSQHKPHIRFTHPRRYNMDNSPSMRSPGQLELSCLSSPPPMKDQNINETLSPELYNNSRFVPQLRSSDLSRADLGHLCHKHDRARYDDGTYYGDELMMSELVSPQFHQARDSSGDVTARRSPRLQFTAFQSPVMQGKVGVEGQTSRRFAHDGSQWPNKLGGEYFPMHWALATPDRP
ncbi:hypothetical protein ED733_008136 [Metarhizium rileyi]|uniref:Uncharacterized protein n=1 Tax=Metarhizium rileyi (strain RCEF 4871) TaxID=1649241 RepID=A0A5C6GH08_METRR|nr:hypothetical protein ED733_008136 [Metarhizium rileyi]